MTKAKIIAAEPGAKPPPNTKRIYRWSDLPDKKEAAVYLIEQEGQKPRKVNLSRHKRQVLEGLLNNPIQAASYCRISDQVSLLRHLYGLDIVCTLYRNDPHTGREKYGVYTLETKVRRASEEINE